MAGIGQSCLAGDDVLGKDIDVNLHGGVVNVGDARRSISFGISEETTVGDVAIIDVGGIRRGASHENVVEDLIVALYLRRRAPRLGPNLSDQGAVLFQIIVIVQRQLFVSSLGGGNRVGVFEVFERVEALH